MTEVTRECSKCGTVAGLEHFYRRVAYPSGYDPRCKPCVREYNRRRVSTWYKEKNRAVQRASKLRLKMAMIAAYGGRCGCCGVTELEFLQIDHIDGGGNRHRKLIRTHMASYLKKLGYPKDGYRLLCANCNFALGKYGYCPHEKQEEG